MAFRLLVVLFVVVVGGTWAYTIVGIIATILKIKMADSKIAAARDVLIIITRTQDSSEEDKVMVRLFVKNSHGTATS